jgi:hypothetical protein
VGLHQRGLTARSDSTKSVGDLNLINVIGRRGLSETGGDSLVFTY